MLLLFPLLLALPVASAPAPAPKHAKRDLDGWRRMKRQDGGGINWSSCPGERETDSRFSCGVFEVPLDWQDLSLGFGQIAVARYSVDPSSKIGTVFTNPGGPGSSGVDDVLGAAEETSRFLGDVYDIVSWDPRGVGEVTIPGTITCFSSVESYEAYYSDSVLDFGIDVRGNLTEAADVEFLYANADYWESLITGIEEQCRLEGNGDMMPYVGTVATVRDMVALADAIVGPDQPINYWGFSYGTTIGNVFINMFPDRVGRVILDGVQDPWNHFVNRPDFAWRELVESADEAFQGFANGCSEAGPSACILADEEVNGGKDIISWTQDLINLAYDLVIQGLLEPGSSYALRSSLHNVLYTPSIWADYANQDAYQGWQTLTALANGETPERRALSRLLRKRQEGQVEGQLDFIPDHTFESIACGDSADPDGVTTTDVIDEFIRVSREVSGTFGPQFGQPSHRCHAWPVRAVERYQGPFNSPLPNNILVIGNTADPTTPFKSAKAVADALGDSATLIEQDGFGHLTVAQRSECMLKIMNDFWVNGNRPEGDATICQVDGDASQIFTGETISGSTPGDNLDEDSQDAGSDSDSDGASILGREGSLIVFGLTAVSVIQLLLSGLV